MNSAVQYIKDFQGNDVWAVLPIEEYRFLRDRAYCEEIDDIPEEHKRILDQRIEKYKNHPEDVISYEELKRSIKSEFGI
ncbi:putative addiction module component [Capnocytophaga leadbetteri]|jgi:hypothetical protein|uniref:Putative addiction module component n=2 Tax=Capnocytophaga leadbetteri TaxID=327575 RepID=A0A2T5XVS5_9FLAO|nr:addiction module protein [Capnocytophaga leadbetteri]PTX07478.1 putative addiction module component [Capnocytophaga leadbetteri]